MKNSKIKRILVPVDFSETSEIAVAEAMTLAKLLKAELFLIHVTEFDRNYMAVVEPNMETIFPDLKEAKVIVEKKLETMRMKIQKESGINPILFLAEGIVHSEIIDYSKKKKINLIVMGTHGVSGLKEIFVGTNTYRVVTLSDIPVLTMQKKLDKKGFKNILIPIDNSLHSREKVNIAMVFAEVYGAKIHIIGLPNSEDKLELKQFKIKLESVEKIVKEDKLPYITTIVKGQSIAKNAIKYAEKNKCDLIVINTGHESNVTGSFLGAFAQQIVNHSKIPVLSFKHSEGHFSIDTEAYGIG